MAKIIHLTDKPVRNATAIIQELRLALDVSEFDELDLLLTVYEGASVTVEVWTGMQLDTEEGWVLAGTFPATVLQGENKLNVKNFLHFIRWKQTAPAGAATFLINGVGRRWA